MISAPTLRSYVGTITSVVLAAGIVFQFPILVYFLSKVGLVTPDFLKKYRRHSLVLIVTLSAIITPPDVFSQVLVALPLMVLYEIGIAISKRIVREREEEMSDDKPPRKKKKAAKDPEDPKDPQGPKDPGDPRVPKTPETQRILKGQRTLQRQRKDLSRKKPKSPKNLPLRRNLLKQRKKRKLKSRRRLSLQKRMRARANRSKAEISKAKPKKARTNRPGSSQAIQKRLGLRISLNKIIIAYL